MKKYLGNLEEIKMKIKIQQEKILEQEKQIEDYIKKIAHLEEKVINLKVEKAVEAGL
jgi:2C-methyl-D-erythritol 2,4-cyclodiphosphate synthase